MNRRWLVLLFAAVPLLEIWIIVSVGQVIGPWWTILLLLAMAIIGAWLIRREGARAWRALTDSIASGRPPTRELADAALVLVGGTLMITPGFLTDIVGLLLIAPVTRPTARRLLTWLVGRRLLAATVTGYGAGRQYPGYGAGRPPGGGPVIPGEVVDRDDQPRG